MNLRFRLGVPVLALASLALTCSAQTSSSTPPAPQQDQRRQLEDFYRTHYTKHEYHVPMRDGV